MEFFKYYQCPIQKNQAEFHIFLNNMKATNLVNSHAFIVDRKT